MGFPKALEDKYLPLCGQPSLLESGRAAKWQHHTSLSLSWSQHLYFSKPQHFRVILLPQSGLTSSLLEWLQQETRKNFSGSVYVLSSKWFRLSFSISEFQNGPGPSLPSRPADFRSDPHCHFSSDLSEGELFRNWSVNSINSEILDTPEL